MKGKDGKKRSSPGFDQFSDNHRSFGSNFPSQLVFGTEKEFIILSGSSGALERITEVGYGE